VRYAAGNRPEPEWSLGNGSLSHVTARTISTLLR
jgi:hypothetical protein